MKYLDAKNRQYVNEDYFEVSFLGSEFRECIFLNCDFTGAFLTGVQFIDCEFYDCSFNKAYVFRSLFKKCVFNECTFYDALLSTVDFDQTQFQQVKWAKDFVINSPPIVIDGLEYPVTLFDNGYMQIGCFRDSYKYFFESPDKEASKLEGLKSRRFWKKYKHWLLELAKLRGLYASTN